MPPRPQTTIDAAPRTSRHHGHASWLRAFNGVSGWHPDTQLVPTGDGGDVRKEHLPGSSCSERDEILGKCETSHLDEVSWAGIGNAGLSESRTDSEICGHLIHSDGVSLCEWRRQCSCKSHRSRASATVRRPGIVPHIGTHQKPASQNVPDLTCNPVLFCVLFQLGGREVLRKFSNYQ